MANTIKIRNSATSGTSPTSLVAGELAINTADLILYAKNTGTNNIEIITKAAYFRSQLPNTFLAGPAAGANAVATYRSIVKADLPTTVGYTDVDNVWNDKTQSRINLKDYSEQPFNPTISANVLTLNLENGNYFYVNFNADINTINIINPPVSGLVGSFTLELIMDGTARAIVWPTSIRWANATPPSNLTVTANYVNMFTFSTRNGGTTWMGFVPGQNYTP